MIKTEFVWNQYQDKVTVSMTISMPVSLKWVHKSVYIKPFITKINLQAIIFQDPSNKTLFIATQGWLFEVISTTNLLLQLRAKCMKSISMFFFGTKHATLKLMVKMTSLLHLLLNETWLSCQVLCLTLWWISGGWCGRKGLLPLWWSLISVREGGPSVTSTGPTQARRPLDPLRSLSQSGRIWLTIPSANSLLRYNEWMVCNGCILGGDKIYTIFNFEIVV